MRLKDDVRKELWKRYFHVEQKLNDLRSIVQNSYDLNEIELQTHKESTDKLCEELKSIHQQIIDDLKG